MSKFTPGPWRWMENKYRGGYSGLCGAENIAVLFPNSCNDGDDGDAWFEDFPSEADANLIAAAPEMYEALQTVFEEWNDNDGFSSLDRTMKSYNAIRKALAKADGEDY